MQNADCKKISSLLRLIAAQQCGGKISEHEFSDAVLAIEADEIAPRGMNLSGSAAVARDGSGPWTVLELRCNGSSKAATFEFLPTTGEFRRWGSPQMRFGLAGPEQVGARSAEEQGRFSIGRRPLRAANWRSRVVE
jgi:hypothetical protein